MLNTNYVENPSQILAFIITQNAGSSKGIDVVSACRSGHPMTAASTMVSVALGAAGNI
jgi:hypothetical protein